MAIVDMLLSWLLRCPCDRYSIPERLRSIWVNQDASFVVFRAAGNCYTRVSELVFQRPGPALRGSVSLPLRLFYLLLICLTRAGKRFLKYQGTTLKVLDPIVARQEGDAEGKMKTAEEGGPTVERM